jgi:hypothetical protein
LWRTCEYTSIHTSEYMETVYELPLLPNNSASATFLHKSVVVRSVDGLFIIGAPFWRWLGQIRDIGQNVLNILFKQEVVTTLVTVTFSFLSYSLGRQNYKYNNNYYYTMRILYNIMIVCIINDNDAIINNN